MTHQAPADPDLPPGVTLRPHVYDGIQEYDQRLPNWWLWTLYLSIIFSVIYWMEWYVSSTAESDHARVTREMNAVEAARLAAVSELDDDTLAAMARNPAFVSAGRAKYVTNCAVCHLPNLRGKEEGGIGESLVDGNWMYGGSPTDIFRIIFDGSPNKASGMQAWGGQLGARGTSEIVAFILSEQPDPAGLR